MTIASTLNKHTYNGNGATYEWPYTFSIFSASDIKVYLTDENGAVTKLTTGYNVDTADSQVLYPYPTSGTKLPNGYKITLKREIDIVQETALPNQGAYFAKTIEGTFDRSIAIDQQQQEQIDRTLKHAVSVGSDVSTELPEPVPLTSFRWDSTGKKLEQTLDPATVIPVVEAIRDEILEAKTASQDAATRAESSAEVLSQYQADTFFEVDTNGDYMPALEPGVSNKFQLDEKLDIMPI